jgi:hypothetical protein
MRFAWLLLFVVSCGKLIDDTDAGDAAIPNDASDATTGEGGGGPFSCGESGHFVDCDSTTQYCQLIKTSKTHAYSCQPLPANCTTQASSQGDCGCFQSGAEIFLTICE